MKTKYDPILTELLKVLAKLRLFTIDQAYRFFEEEDHAIVLDALARAVRNGVIGRRKVLVPAPTEKKIKKGNCLMRSVEIYFLNQKGRRTAARYFQNDARYARVGAPQSVHSPRVYHDLLIVEALLYLMLKYDVVDYYNEEQLRSEDQTVADLRVIVRGSGGYEMLDCEVVVQNTRQQIAAKSDNLVWFTPIRRQAEIISWLKNARVVLLQLKTNVQPKMIKKRALSELETAALGAIIQHKGALTAGAVGKVIGKPREKMSQMLNELADFGFVYAAELHENPHRPVGRPRKIYALNPADLASSNYRLAAVRHSKKIEGQPDFFFRETRFEKTKTAQK